jgi:hypothetical protein
MSSKTNGAWWASLNFWTNAHPALQFQTGPPSDGERRLFFDARRHSVIASQALLYETTRAPAPMLPLLLLFGRFCTNPSFFKLMMRIALGSDRAA